ncbi:MAG: DUF1080 domain-containing protein [Bacteroidetes bacterium]|nr:DUF1080 domain-containing protein [Bacteroidota bacterium]
MKSKDITIPIILLTFTLQFSGCTSKESPNQSKVTSEPEALMNQDFTTLFDGKSFDGWKGGNMDMFRIEDGAVVAGSMEERIPRNEFLCTEIEYGNFELRLKAKMQGEGDNAGIQFRSKRIPDHHEVSGYQCDMGSDPSGKIWGFLYDESRRRRMLATADYSEMLKVYKPDDWNDFIIRAEGARIQIWLNAFQTVDYTEDDPSVFETGVICLQIHGGKPAEAWYKDVKIKQL